MQDLKLIRWVVCVVVGLGLAAFLATLPPVAGLAGAAAVLALCVLGTRLLDRRRANSQSIPKYSDTELKNRVRDAMRSKHAWFVEEVRRDVAAQWGDGTEYHKLSAKLTALSGRRVVPEIPSNGDWDEGTLKRLYPNVYGQAEAEGGGDSEYD